MTLSLRKQLVLAAMWLSLLLFGAVSTVSAQDILDVEPLDNALQINDGETQSITVTVKNISTNTVEVTPTYRNITPQNSGGFNYDSPSLDKTIEDWLAFDANTFELKPSATRNISVAITAPVNKSTETRWGALTFEAVAEDDKEEIVIDTASSRIFVAVQGEAMFTDTVTAAITTERSENSYTFASDIVNDATTLYEATGDIVIMNGNQEIIDTIDLTLDDMPEIILPGYSKSFITNWEPLQLPEEGDEFIGYITVYDKEGATLFSNVPAAVAPQDPGEESEENHLCEIILLEDNGDPCAYEPAEPNLTPIIIASVLGTLFVGGIIGGMVWQIRRHHHSSDAAAPVQPAQNTTPYDPNQQNPPQQ